MNDCDSEKIMKHEFFWTSKNGDTLHIEHKPEAGLVFLSTSDEGCHRLTMTSVPVNDFIDRLGLRLVATRPIWKALGAWFKEQHENNAQHSS